MRRAVIDDFGWWHTYRNSASAVAASGGGKPLTSDQALDKFTMLREPDLNVFWMIEPSAGWVTLECEDYRGEISIFVTEWARGQGVGSMAVKQMCRYADKEIGMEAVIARVREENIASSALFTKCGFELDSTSEDMWNFKWEPGE